ncbi:DUF2975 domain-containing protein [Paenibacillus sp. B2(2019)]|uniref:DUF2975 domain-containing protein n=1 Tax=Paenibacillus sp. B2(2019) TaxID=2607754 RepID=UPI0011F26011|nr:DUF2975 domain-containing protein [Paenibacillus sp. B2(2019)]KAA1191521.1 DUF2975 domain-containing protein [Paenibacillus sp. B2(2019)]
MKRETLFLKIVVILIGLPVLALCIFWLPTIPNKAAGDYRVYLVYPVLIGVYVTVIAYFVALYQALRLLSYIDKNKAFSELSIKALKNIIYCAIIISILYAAGMPLIYEMAQEADAPGLIVLGLVMTCAPIVIAVFAAVLQKLLKNAIEIKSENDLTV